MITEMRQRVTRDLFGRRGTVADPVWVNRRLLLSGAEHLSTKQWKRLQVMLDSCDPTKEIGAAWGVKERLRLLLGEREPSKIRWRLAEFYERRDAPRNAGDHPTPTDHPDLVASHPHRAHRRCHQRQHRRVQPAHQTDQESRPRIFNLANYERRILSHIAVTRPQRIRSMKGNTPLKIEEAHCNGGRQSFAGEHA
jgi:transposase